MTTRALLLLPLLLAATAPEAPPGAEPAAMDLPATVTAQCTRSPNASGLVHLRCGASRLLVVQPRPLDRPLHDEVLDSLLDLVPGRSLRRDDALDDVIRATITQDRAGLSRDTLSVMLVVTSRLSSGRTAACVFGVDGRPRTERAEQAWCADMTEALAPPPPSPPTATLIEVQQPDHGLEDLAGP